MEYLLKVFGDPGNYKLFKQLKALNVRRVGHAAHLPNSETPSSSFPADGALDRL